MIIGLFTPTIILAAFLTLYLYQPNAYSFIKHINLTNNQCIKIGHQTNAKIGLAENNHYINSKVLSCSMQQSGRRWAQSVFAWL